MDEQQVILQRIETKVDKLSLILVGNGEVGLCEKVRALEQWRDQKQSRSVWFNRAVIVSLLTLLAKAAAEMCVK